MTTNYVEEKRTSLEEAISSSSDVDVDTIWALLKYKEIGIFRKVACICNLLGLNFNKSIKEMPQDDNGRILDYKTRHLIHDALIKSS
tara:strand:- start:737 stop:997 length:261 start_codon:yes stop_codon:yes gene_type:complete